MARIIPWKLPDVEGGSVGGYTPAPTPTPLINYPYDLDNLSVDVQLFEIVRNNSDIGQGGYAVYTKGKIEVSNAVILDATGVSSVIATVDISSGTASYLINGGSRSNTINAATIDVEIGSIMSVSGGEADITNNTTGSGYGYTKYIDAAFENYGAATSATAGSITSDITLVSIKVYNSNGVVLQEWTPPEE